MNKVVKYNLKKSQFSLQSNNLTYILLSGAGSAAGSGGGGHSDLLQPGLLCREGDSGRYFYEVFDYHDLFLFMAIRIELYKLVSKYF